MWQAKTFIFTALRGLATRKLSVCPSVKRLDCDKTEESSVPILYHTKDHSHNAFDWRLLAEFSITFEPPRLNISLYAYDALFLKMARKEYISLTIGGHIHDHAVIKLTVCCSLLHEQCDFIVRDRTAAVSLCCRMQVKIMFLHFSFDFGVIFQPEILYISWTISIPVCRKHSTNRTSVEIDHKIF